MGIPEEREQRYLSLREENADIKVNLIFDVLFAGELQMAPYYRRDDCPLIGKQVCSYVVLRSVETELSVTNRTAYLSWGGRVLMTRHRAGSVGTARVTSADMI